MFFGCLPLFPLPQMLQCNALVGNLLTSIRSTCPNHLKLPLYCFCFLVSTS